MRRDQIRRTKHSWCGLLAVLLVGLCQLGAVETEGTAVYQRLDHAADEVWTLVAPGDSIRFNISCRNAIERWVTVNYRKHLRLQINGELRRISHSRHVKTDPPGAPASYCSDRHTRDGPNEIVISNASDDEMLQVQVFQCVIRPSARPADAAQDNG